MATEERGYFLSTKDADELRRIGVALGLDFDHWLADRERTSYVKRMNWLDDQLDRIGREHDSTYAHLRAVIENCKHSPVEAIRHQLVGLLPEVRTLDADVAERMREKGLGHLVELQEERAREGWAEFGYGKTGPDEEVHDG